MFPANNKRRFNVKSSSFGEGSSFFFFDKHDSLNCRIFCVNTSHLTAAATSSDEPVPAAFMLRDSGRLHFRKRGDGQSSICVYDTSDRFLLHTQIF